MNKNSIFIDTGGFYSLLVSNDSYHKSAIAIVSSQKNSFVTSDYVLDETLTLLKSRGIAKQVNTLLEIIRESESITVERLGQERFNSSVNFYASRLDRGYSFTDCTSFILMEELGLTKALANDKHFSQAGFVPLLK